MTEQRIELTASDGTRLDARITRPAGAKAAAVVCHPHPDYGGSMRVPFVEIACEVLSDAGLTTLRFDFRRPGTTAQRRTDLAAAVDEVGSRPVLLVGWSFGADLALWHASGDDRVRWVAAVAPPLRMAPADAITAVASKRVLVLAPEHDQYAPPDVARERAPSGAVVETLRGADHFLGGAEDAAARRILEWWTEASREDE